MNRYAYRIIFNARRGQLMAVAETTATVGKAAGAPRKPVRFRRSRCTFAVLAALGTLGLPTAAAYAQIVANPAAPGTQQPTVLQSANGVPLVNIQTPNAAGVSMNRYSQFDVQQNGTILNNSRTNTPTQLGGWVQGNPWLATGSAGVIVNQVESSRPSLLNGYTEVAGQRAGVVVANPSGISVNGGGFINASGVTLTTGTPQFGAGGALAGFNVQSGQIGVGGNGLDLTGTDYAQLLARAVSVNAGVWAKDLHVVTGVNQVSADGQGITAAGAAQGTTPSFAVDVGQLGGMYAGKIFLVGTEAGLGVSNGGAISASNGPLTLSADGKLGNGGTLAASGAGQDVNLNVKGLANSGTIASQHDVNLTVGGAASSNSGQINAARQLVASTTALDNQADGTITAQRLQIITQALQNAGTIQQTGAQNLSVSTAALTNTGANAVLGSPLSSTGGSGSAGSNTPSASAGAVPTSAAGGSQVVAATAAVETLPAGQIRAAQSLVNSGVLVANGGTDVTTTTNLINAGTLNVRNLNASGAFDNSGGVAQVQSFSGEPFIFANQGGHFFSQADLKVNTGVIRNVMGQIGTAGSLMAQAAHGLGNAGGTLSARGDVTLTAQSIDNSTGGQIASTAGGISITAAGALDNRSGDIHTVSTDPASSVTVRVASVDNSGGRIAQAGVGAMQMAAGGVLTNDRGQIVSGGTLGLSAGALSNNGGTIAAQGGAMVGAGSIFNRHGTLQAGGGTAAPPADLVVTSAGVVDNTQGTLAATGNTQAQAGTLDNSAGTVNGLGAIALTIGGALINTAGTLQSGGNVTMASGSTVNDQGGVILAVGNLDVATGVLSNQGSTLGAKGAVTAHANGVDNRSGVLYGATVDVLSADGVGHWAQVDNRGGVIAAKDVLTIATAGVDNTQGTLQTSAANSTLQIASHGGAVTNRQSGNEGGIRAAGDLGIDAQGGTLDNSDGGYIGAVGNSALAAGNVVNRGGTVASNASLQITGSAAGGAGIDNTSGAIEAKGNVTLIAANAGIVNAAGMLHSDRDLALQSGGTMDNTAGTIDAAGNASITDSHVAAGAGLSAATQDLINTAGTIQAGQSLAVRSRSATGDGKIEALGDLTLALASDYTQSASGTLAANGNLAFGSLGSLTNQGRIIGGTGAAIIATNIDNRAGAAITAAGTTSVSAAGSLINRGLIDGSDTQINAGMLSNIGSGRIYGDHVSVAAGTVNNGAEGATSATIAARVDLDIGATMVNNTGGATLMSLNDMRIGGALDGGRKATGQAHEINNAGSQASPNSGGINAGSDLTLSAESVNNTNPDLTVLHDVSAASQRTPDMYSYPGTDPLPQSEFAWTRNESGVLGEHLVIPVHPERFATAYPPAYTPESTTCPNTDWGTCATQALYRESRNSARFADFGVAPPPQTAVPEPDPVAYGGRAAYQYDPRTDSNLLVYYWPDGSDQAGYNTALSAYNADQTAYANAAIALNNAINAANVENKRVYDSSVNHGNDFAAYTGITQQVTEDRGVNSGPGRITAGGNMAISGSLNNIDSTVIAGGSIAIRPDHLNNQSTKGTQKTTTSGTVQAYHVKYHAGGLLDGASYSNDPQGPAASYSSITERTIDLVPHVYLQGAQTDRPDGALTNGNTAQNVAATGLNALGVMGGSGVSRAVPAVSQHASHSASGAAITVRTLSSRASVPTSSLYALNAANSNAPLVETDPAFTNHGQWLNSDYMLQQLGADPAAFARRLGDGFYEQQLIQQQVGQLTGQRFLGDYTSNDAEYRALMSAGVSYAKANNLRPGIALTPEQIAALTSDVVWLVDEEVDLPDGSTQTVLVPKLYVVAQAGDLVPTGALISGKDVVVGAAGDVSNSGTIVGRRTVQIAANDINDTLGRITGRQVGLAAVRDINVVGGSIEAAETLLAYAGRDLNVASTTRTSTGGTAQNGYSNTTLDRIGGINVGGAGRDGTLYLGAARDLSTSGAQIRNDSQTGATVLDAGRNLTLGTAGIAQALNIGIDDKRHINRGASSEVGTSIDAAGDARLTAGQDVIARAASVQAQGDLQMLAGGDLTIDAGAATRRIDDAYYSESSGFLSHSSGRSLDQVTQTWAQGSNLGGRNVILAAGNGLNVNGSSVIADQNAALVAGGDIAITAAENTTTERHERESHESGFLSGGGFGITYGTREQSGQQQTISARAAASTVGAIAGDVDIRAGNHYQQTGSDVVAPGGDIAIIAKQINIQEAREQSYGQSEQHFRQSGITLSLGGGVLALGQQVAQSAQGVVQSDSRRDQLMNALALYGQQANLMAAAKAVANADDAGEAAAASGVKVSLSIGTNKSDSQSESTSDTSRASSVQAGGNMSFNATESDLTVQGALIRGGGNVTLQAARDINLQASADNMSERSSNSNSSGSIGVSFGVGKGSVGLSLDVSAAHGSGQANSDSTQWNNTHVEAGQILNIKSGGDTNLRGAVAGGQKVKADVGGNLTIASLQDTTVGDMSQRQTGFSMSIPTTSAGGFNASASNNRQSSRNDYASVWEQSGLIAGSQGFDIAVDGHTQLDGAVIASSAKSDKNRLQTASLTTTDLQNHMDAEASSSGITLGTTMLSSKYAAVMGALGNLTNHGDAEAHDQSSTQSAISAGQITVGGKITDTSKAPLIDSNGNTVGTDTQNASRALVNADLAALQQAAQKKQASNVLLTRAVSTFTDEAYRVMYQSGANVYRVPPGCGDQSCAVLLSEPEARQLAASQDGVIHVSNNGIFNDLDSAVKYAQQHASTSNADGSVNYSDKPQNQYVIFQPETNNVLSELLVAGYSKTGLSITLGLTNAEQRTAQIIQDAATDGQALQIDSHSRGTMTTQNAIDYLNANGGVANSDGQGLQLTMRNFGAAQNAESANAGLRQITGNTDAQVYEVTHIKDLVGTKIGGNTSASSYTSTDPNGVLTTTTSNDDGKGFFSNFGNILTGTATPHNCYGTSSGTKDCNKQWDNIFKSNAPPIDRSTDYKPPIEIPNYDDIIHQSVFLQNLITTQSNQSANKLLEANQK